VAGVRRNGRSPTRTATSTDSSAGTDERRTVSGSIPTPGRLTTTSTPGTLGRHVLGPRSGVEHRRTCTRVCPHTCVEIHIRLSSGVSSTISTARRTTWYRTGTSKPRPFLTRSGTPVLRPSLPVACFSYHMKNGPPSIGTPVNGSSTRSSRTISSRMMETTDTGWFFMNATTGQASTRPTTSLDRLLRGEGALDVAFILTTSDETP